MFIRLNNSFGFPFMPLKMTLLIGCFSWLPCDRRRMNEARGGLQVTGGVMARHLIVFWYGATCAGLLGIHIKRTTVTVRTLVDWKPHFLPAHYISVKLLIAAAKSHEVSNKKYLRQNSSVYNPELLWRKQNSDQQILALLDGLNSWFLR